MLSVVYAVIARANVGNPRLAHALVNDGIDHAEHRLPKFAYSRI
jgi:hypothetical protein